MAGRGSVWSDPKVKELSREFTPATDESFRLQTSDDRQAQFFRTMVHGDPKKVSGSRQGTYICTPGGRLLARGNSTDPRAIERIMAGGLQAWNALSPEERARPVPPSLLPEHRYEHFYPSEGLALLAVHRERVPDEPNSFRGMNLDHAWFSKEEIDGWWQTFRGAADEATRGVISSARIPVPAPLVDRWVRLHLVDNVRGQEGPFAPEDVERAEVTARVLESTGDRVRIAIEGRTRVETDGVWKMGESSWKNFPPSPRGVEVRLIGTAIYDRREARFVEFQLVALGESWGSGKLNGRGGREEGVRTPLAWRFSLIPPGAPD